ncbi:hypothetical protein OS493_026153 [Desmophyllum pertusum]|uniref:Uncharacterized protein n=1 Tax=Desmophyllum pertusum TaxID=174260 RepID=A0A9W9ZZZ4_9CNID|nr:hypothetical protein OS493_026153 [Desmophyllum pertusum]
MPMYNTIDEIVQALKTKEVDGMMLDRYTASYYQTRGKLESLLTVKKLELQRDVGVLFSKNRNDLAECLDVFRSNISRLVQTLTATIKLTQQKRTKNVSLFDHSSPFMKMVMYTSLGILLTLVFLGTLYDLLMRRNWARCKQDARISEAVNEGTTAKRQTILNDLKVARGLLLQMQEHFNELEAEVSKLSLNDNFNYQQQQTLFFTPQVTKSIYNNWTEKK